MNLINVLPVLAIAFASPLNPNSDFQRGVFEDIINGTIQNFIDNLTDPFESDRLEIDLEVLLPILKGKIILVNLKSVGQKSVQIPALIIQTEGDIALNGTLTLPLLDTSSDLENELSISLGDGNDVSLVGTNGSFSLHLEGLQVDFHAKLNASTVDNVTTSEIYDTWVRITLAEASTFNLEGIEVFGLTLGSDLNQTINEALQLIKSDPDAFSESFSPTIEALLNGILNPPQDAPSGPPSGAEKIFSPIFLVILLLLKSLIVIN